VKPPAGRAKTAARPGHAAASHCQLWKSSHVHHLLRHCPLYLLRGCSAATHPRVPSILESPGTIASAARSSTSTNQDAVLLRWQGGSHLALARARRGPEESVISASTNCGTEDRGLLQNHAGSFRQEVAPQEIAIGCAEARAARRIALSLRSAHSAHSLRPRPTHRSDDQDNQEKRLALG